ncbi:CitMHS family transporter [Hephaestia mangrovi]|uniref:CitMHS family transporter n=1 Tax=Hephaestia mangrovi TaxID=2873268 RepID=UPI001CA741E6|nr:citrate:proton symporter [Hephaestia mangrovi]MBY8829861.1 citrate:proton symporter [Hephaestia mangrovi]
MIMLMWLGYLMVATFMIAIMTRRLSALVALVLVPIVFGMLAGHGVDLGPMVVSGISKLAPTATLLLFAVLYFAVMIDVGLFDPLVNRVLKVAGDDPARLAVGTALVAMIVSLDGDGATTALITVTAFLPVYRRIGMNPLILATLLGLSVCVVNLTPWGGPTGRVAAALQLNPADVFVPLLPTMLAGMVATLLIAWHLGRAERRRLNTGAGQGASGEPERAMAFDRDASLLRPRLIWVNLLLTLALFGLALGRLAPLSLVFMGGFALALLINFPGVTDQRARLQAYAANALPIVLLILAAGLFTGVMAGTGMIDAMAKGAMAIVPASLGPSLGAVTAFLSAPLMFTLSNDALFFGVVPVIAQAAAGHGVAPAAIARASLLGTAVHGLSPLVAAVYLVTGLVGCELSALQRFALKWAVVVTLVMIGTAMLTGAI